MKKYLLFLGLILLFSCKEETQVKTAPTQVSESIESETEQVTDLNTTTTQVDVVFENEQFTTIYKAYLSVKAALVNTNPTTTQTVVVNMRDEVSKLYKAENLMEALNTMAASDEISVQRKAFEQVSGIMEILIAGQKIVSGSVYKQYCPMAFDGKGAFWLSDSDEIRNPYFGDQMLKCGVVNKEIQ